MDCTLALPAELTIYVLAELRPPWLDWLHRVCGGEAEVAVDGRAVQEIDAAGLQFLVAVARSLEAHHQRLHVDAPSPALAQGCRRIGAAWLLEPHSEGARS